MFCDHCGTANRDEARFCRSCGAPLAPGVSAPGSSLPTREGPPAVPEAVRVALADGFDVVRLLGEGGMGVVYLARERALDRPVAIKVLRAELASDERNVQRFLQEARLAARLRHPNIVSVHAVGSRGAVHYFTMDFVEGSTLDRHARSEGGLLPTRTRPILLAIARAVGHAHRQGIVHRDLKPNNVMIDGSGHVFVMDFGLAKPRDSGALTTVGAVVGTPQYMSPEQFDGRGATARSDVYALGLIHFFLLTGEHLVRGETMASMIAQHLSGSVRTRLAADPRVSEADRSLILAMLETDPQRRPTSVEALLPALESAAHSGPSPDPPTRTPGPGTGFVPERQASTPASPMRRRARERIQALLKKRDDEKK